MKIGYGIATLKSPLEFTLSILGSAPSCRGRCYLPRTVFQFLSPFALFAPFAVKDQPGQAQSSPVKAHQSKNTPKKIITP